MNQTKAEELANWLETGEIEEIDLKEAATMLRQQQAEIEALKGQYKFGVDWSKDGSAVSVVRINKDGVAEVVFHHFNPSFVK